MTFVRIDDIQMAYTDQGLGRPVVLIHGYPFNRSLWNEQVAALSSSYRVITPDLRGFGETDPSEGPATMNRMADDVAHLMDHLGISQAVIGGLSMGGYVALAFYKQFPSRVRALVLADTRAQADTEEAKQTRAQQAEKALSEGMAGIADAMLPKLLTPETVSKRPEIVKRVRDMMLKTKPEGAAAAVVDSSSRCWMSQSVRLVTTPEWARRLPPELLAKAWSSTARTRGIARAWRRSRRGGGKARDRSSSSRSRTFSVPGRGRRITGS